MKKNNIEKQREAIRTFEGLKPFNIKPKISIKAHKQALCENLAKKVIENINNGYVPEFILNNTEVETPEFLRKEK